MKKLIITIAIVLGMGMTLSAQIDENMYETKGGLFGMGQNIFTNPDEEMFLPYGYAEEETFIPEAYAGMNDNWDAGLFGLGSKLGGNRNGNALIDLPITHGSNDDQNAPLGSGIAVLTALGAAYLVGKRRKS
jgi:hypothetical protein